MRLTHVAAAKCAVCFGQICVHCSVRPNLDGSNVGTSEIPFDQSHFLLAMPASHGCRLNYRVGFTGLMNRP